MSEISGFFISFNAKDQEIVKKRFEQLGFDYDIDGIKEFILSSCKGKYKKKNNGDVIIDMIKENPEIISSAVDIGRKILSKKIKNAFS